MRSLLTLLLASFTLAFFAAPASAADLKIGTADFSRAMNEIEDGKKAQARLDTMMQGKQAEIQQLEENIIALQEEYQAKAAVLSDVARQEYEQRLYQMQMQYQQVVMGSEQEMQTAYMQVMDQLLGKLRDVATELGEEQGYTVILETSQGAVVFSVDSIDVTDEIIRRYNAAHPSSN